MKPAEVKEVIQEKGMILQEVLIGIFLVSLLGAACLGIFSNSTKDLLRASDSEVLEAELSRSIAVIFSAQQLSPDIFGTPLYHWRNLAEPQPEYLSTHIEGLSENHKPKDQSVLLEIAETGNIIFHGYGTGNAMEFYGEVYKSSLLSELKETYWLTISPFGILRWHGIPDKHFESAQSWKMTLHSSFPSIQVLQYASVRAPSPSELTKPSLLIPLLDHYIIYVSSRHELRRSSLLKSDNQPVAIYIDNISKDKERCLISGLRRKSSRHIRFPCRTKITDAYLRMDALDL